MNTEQDTTNLRLTTCELCDETFVSTSSGCCEACIEFMESEPETGFEALRILHTIGQRR
jgi:hypothetical protein